jgi:CO/xanthine dehydrogenase FAD-binding subunit
MAEEHSRNWPAGHTIHTPLTLQELFGIWQRFPGAVPWAGGTALGSADLSASFLSLPKNTIALDRIEELHRITRTERYLEMGAMVRLNEVTRLGKIIPDVLIRTLLGAAGFPARNLVTMGGLVCSSAPSPAGTGIDTVPGAARSRGAAASFIALDARFELRTAETSRWISATRFYSPVQRQENPGGEARPALARRFGTARARKKRPAAAEKSENRELLTRIRIPLEQWNYSVYRKLHGAEQTGTAVFIARIEKNILTDIRVIFASDGIIRSPAGETALTGKSLPLDRRDVSHFVEQWEAALTEEGKTGSMIRAILLNCIETCARELAD